jgi:hypothetical protein
MDNNRHFATAGTAARGSGTGELPEVTAIPDVGIVGFNPRLVACTTALLLTGCVGQALQEGLHDYHGKPASALFSKLGLPKDTL